MSLVAPAMQAVEMPTLSPDGGTYPTFQTVTVDCATPNAVLHYTVNGLSPTESDATILPGTTREVRDHETLRVRAFLDGASSEVKVGEYVITGQVATSGLHTLILRADGTVWVTGSNTYGQLGDGTTNSRIEPAQVPGFSNVIAVAAGNRHSLALRSDGTVWAWGGNQNNQCGLPSSTAMLTVPTIVSGVPGVKAIAAGGQHSVALTTGGTVYTWGDGTSGKLGSGNTNSSSTPLAVLADVKAIACGGGEHTLALKTDNTVRAWGSSGSGQVGHNSTYYAVSPVTPVGLGAVESIAAGYDHSLAVKADHSVFGWGSNLTSQIGTAGSPIRAVPTAIPELASGIGSVVAGTGFTLARRTSDWTLLGLGFNLSGQLGHGSGTTTATPASVSSLGPVLYFTAGGGSALAIDVQGTVWSWGDNSAGALGLATPIQKNVPIQLLAEEPGVVTALAAGGSHSLAIDAAGVWAWGKGTNGQLGLGSTLTKGSPQHLAGLSALAFAGGSDFTLAVKAGQTVASWGANAYGQLGNGSTTGSTIPVTLSSLSGITRVAAGSSHSLALNTTAGTVFAWGYGSSGQLGKGNFSSSSVPLSLTTPTSVTAIAAGFAHSLARTASGAVWAWGSALRGQLGNNSTTNRSSPVAVLQSGTPLTGVLDVAAGLYHNLAIKPDFTLVAWGDNPNGQLGDNSTTRRLAAVAVSNLTGVSAVSAGALHSIALKPDGTVWAWGANTYGQLGNGTTTQSNVPLQVLGISGAVAIAAGHYHNLALKDDGGLISWGSNASMQLGLGLSLAELKPVPVPGVNVLRAAPGVTITEPAQDAVFAVDEDFTLRVTATDAEGPVQSVEYYNEGFKLGESTTSPYFALTLGIKTWGDFRITATGRDSDGTPSFPSAPVLVHIPPPITLSAQRDFGLAILLNWTATLNTSTTFQLERRVDAGGTTIIPLPASPNGTYRDINGLAFGTTYHYRLRGLNGSATTALSTEESATTASDMDEDGLGDEWEILVFGDFSHLPNVDNDGDGVSNIDEFWAGTNANDPPPAISLLSPSGVILAP